MPKQISRLLIAFAVFVTIFLIVRSMLIPESFGDLGYYRANSLKEIEATELKHAGKEDCAMCHDAVAELMLSDKHQGISCEACHGPGYEHTLSPETIHPEKPHTREFCGLCHGTNAARPNNVVAQIDLNEHNVEDECIMCHNPHKPWENLK